MFVFLYIISVVCLWILLSAILLNFYFARKGNIRKEKKSVVETGSMLAFFIAMVMLAYFKAGRLDLDEIPALVIAVIGTILILTGTVLNISGRISLGGNWGNQIKIYKDHHLVTTGIFHFVRHPLYSSTIMMLYGFSFLFRNYLVLILVSLIFIPFMIYRARQEESALSETFGDIYTEYKSKTGLLFPKLRK